MQPGFCFFPALAGKGSEPVGAKMKTKENLWLQKDG
jgi:hypothetical protein